MKNYTVEVPVYVSMVITAATPAIAAEAGQDYVNEQVVGSKVERIVVNGVTIESQAIEPLDKGEDATPDVYEWRDGRMVSVFHDKSLD